MDTPIKRLDQLSSDEITELAQAACDRNEPLRVANQFLPGTQACLKFEFAYWARHRELTELEA